MHVSVKSLCVLTISLFSSLFVHEKAYSSDHPRPEMASVQNIADRFEEIDSIPMSDKPGFLKEISVAFSQAQSQMNVQMAEDAKIILACLDGLTSCDLGDARLQDTISQKIVLYMIPSASNLPLELEYRLIGHVGIGSSKNINIDGKAVSGREWSELRGQIIGYRLRLWQRINNAIDPTWDPEDKPMLSVSPEIGMGVVEYEKAVKANRFKADRQIEQVAARDMRKRYLPRLKSTIADAYSSGPLTPRDAEILKAYLAIYVHDADLREILFQSAVGSSKELNP